MPAYNAERTLAEAIESILAQKFRDFELIIVDDGSKDKTSEIIERYCVNDNRITLLRNLENKGIVYSLNRAFDSAIGDYIARMDADDISLPDRLTKQVDIMNKNSSIMLLAGGIEYVDSSSKDLGVVRWSMVDDLLCRNEIIHPTVMIRREMLNKFGLRYREEFKYAEDYCLWLEISCCGAIYVIKEVLLKYRVSSSASRIRHMKSMLIATLKVKWFGVSVLKIRPSLRAILRYIGEVVLLLLPSRFVLWMYLRITFGRSDISL